MGTTIVRLSAEPTQTRLLMTRGPRDIGKVILPRAECTPAGGGDVARRSLALPRRAALRCAVCGRGLDFVRARPSRRAGLRRAQHLLRGRRGGAHVLRYGWVTRKSRGASAGFTVV